jgi:hypothetical protein
MSLTWDNLGNRNVHVAHGKKKLKTQGGSEPPNFRVLIYAGIAYEPWRNACNFKPWSSYGKY